MPTTRTVLSVLQKSRILEVAREFGVVVQMAATKDAQIAAFVDAGEVRFQDVLGRDEQKARASRGSRAQTNRRSRPVEPVPAAS